MQFQSLGYALRWTLITIPVAVSIGSMVALFLWLLQGAIHLRFANKWLLYLLPLAGIVIHLIYKVAGKSSEKGNNLILTEITKPENGVPMVMAPLILVTTIITHLFGGSAGREGTAVQIGGSIAGTFGKWFRLDEHEIRILLTAGIAAGFGAVFGTPLTGAIFAMEVLVIGKINYTSLLPCLIAGIVGDLTVAAWGIHHTPYRIDIIPDSSYFLSDYLPVNLLLLFKVILSAIAFGLASYIFSLAIHLVKSFFSNIGKNKWLIPVCGGLTIILLTLLLGKPDYLSLGVDPEYKGAVTIASAFHAGGAEHFSWLWKTIYTAITLGTGFKGGEVTPLFYIGATLGNTLAGWMDAPVGLFAALGFIAVFAGATNTPLACTVMGVELFGSQYILFFAVACFTAYLFSGQAGIYTAQEPGIPKLFSKSKQKVPSSKE
ncbi:voltage-gated chloride channel family protein [Pedobacter sp. BMA]|uniref:voltage-gated chloride channel family protein n=1 Tax=Pedobacter sp. BMA TaxID=1663685 RepID=UPI000AB310E3|nr:voltage-gated chloride channel family protein [Pedobacter sp. BMA]